MSKSNREFFKERWEAELPAFGRVLRALPKDRLDYCPHERSATAAGIGWQLAAEQKALATLCEKGEVQWSQPEAAGGHDAMIAAWDKATEELRGRLASLDDAAWEKKVKFLMTGAPTWETTLDDMCWGFLFDMVHHRGQLSTYIRPMGGKVPAIYGPSGDDAGG